MHEPTLVHTIRFAQIVLLKNVEDVSPEQALLRPEGGGNSLNWVVGHICHARNQMVKLLRGAGHLPDESLSFYQRGDTWTPENAVGLGMLVTHHTAMQQQLVEGLSSLDAERFSSPAPWSPFKDPQETVGSLLTKSIAHEIYHAGQAGVLRRLLGLQGAIRSA